MKFDREIVFSWLEEDNTQRAYFRLKPLLTVSGDAQAEAAALWPDEGALRIVPDKNEQGYFKDRMRALGHFCTMDLTAFPAEANKIRTNKNYRPEKEEHNQFILYSDTVKPVPEHTFYELLEGAPEDAAALAASAVTPLFMIRAGDTLFGPVKKQAPAVPSAAPAMEAVVYDVPCPDGKIRTILCHEEKAEEAPAEALPAAEIVAPVAAAPEEAQAEQAEESLPLGKPLNILDRSKDFDQTLEGLNQPVSQGANLLRRSSEEAAPVEEPAARPALTGTPLLRSAPLRTAVPRPKNRVQEVVANQWRAARNDPPAAPLPAGAAMHHVENPVERACMQLQQTWQMPEAQQQLVDFVLSLPGMNARLMPALASPQGETPLQKAIQRRLEDLEAERLTALVQLDKAQENLEAFRQSAIDDARSDAAAKLRELTEQIQAQEERLADLRAQMNALAAQRDALQEQITRLQQDDMAKALADAMAKARLVAPVEGEPLHLHTRCGDPAPVDQLVGRVQEAASHCGVTCSHNAAVAVLALAVVAPCIGLSCPTPAAAATLCENLAGAMGWRCGFGFQTHTTQTPVLDAPLPGGTPLLLLSTLSASYPVQGMTRLMLSRAATTPLAARSQAYESDPWPILPVPELPFIEQAAPEKDGTPVSLAALDAPATEEEEAPIQAVLKPLMDVLPPLSGRAYQEMKRFIVLCARHMEGGLAAACDWAIMLWLLPQAEHNANLAEKLKPLLAEYPLSAARL